MEILAHRGYWKDATEKNSLLAFERALKLGYGIELDIRDCNGELVIAHDAPLLKPETLRWSQFLELYQTLGASSTIAVNIKADGLALLTWQAIPEKLRQHFFAFDMSVPDALAYLGVGARAFTRHSELEPVPCYYQRAHGVWMDEFEKTWISDAAMRAHVKAGKVICLVSPELQKRPHLDEWAQWKLWWSQWPAEDLKKVMLCTDFPEEAEHYFLKP